MPTPLHALPAWRPSFDRRAAGQTSQRRRLRCLQGPGRSCRRHSAGARRPKARVPPPPPSPPFPTVVGYWALPPPPAIAPEDRATLMEKNPAWPGVPADELGIHLGRRMTAPMQVNLMPCLPTRRRRLILQFRLRDAPVKVVALHRFRHCHRCHRCHPYSMSRRLRRRHRHRLSKLP